jgi:glucosamine--fructose-6-phosphate aminotransferase (isomerizing)
MCSIIGLSGSAQAAPLVVQGLGRMEYRGYDSAGVAAVLGGRISVLKGVGRVAEVNSRLRLDSLGGNVAIGHTRWATHGGVTDYNAHPHLSTGARVAVVHNGIIENYEKIKLELVSEGFSFKSETDSEVIANLLEKWFQITGEVEGALARTVAQLTGRYAFVAAFDNGVLAATREHEPLILGIGRNGFYVASDVLGFAQQTDRVIFMENSEFAVIDRGRVGLYDNRGRPVPHEVTTVARELADADKGRFVHFTLKEIHEQPGTALRAGSLGDEEIGRLAKLMLKSQRVWFIGCGTSYHAALIGSHLISKNTDLGVTAAIASESKFRPFKTGPDTLVVALSQSGETADVLEAVELARGKGARIASLVNVATSSLARASDVAVALHCGPEVGVAATKSFTAQVATLFRLAEKVSGEKFHAGLGKLPAALERALDTEGQVRELAKRMRGASDVYVLGAGPHCYSAMEASLKLKELSYVHAEALPGGELKHGPLALIDRTSAVLIFNPRDETYDDTLASAHEVKSRGAKIVGVSDIGSEMYDTWIPLPTLDEVLYPLVEVVPVQLLAYYLALEKKTDPDYPRNLAKSVTVK